MEVRKHKSLAKEWQDKNEILSAQISDLRSTIDQLTMQLYGQVPKAERENENSLKNNILRLTQEIKVKILGIF
jgi:hypothetical protein